MPADSYRPKQKIRVRHREGRKDAETKWHDGEIVAHVKDDVWRVTFGGFGLFFLVPEKDIADAEVKTENQGGEESGGQGNNARV